MQSYNGKTVGAPYLDKKSLVLRLRTGRIGGRLGSRPSISRPFIRGRRPEGLLSIVDVDVMEVGVVAGDVGKDDVGEEEGVVGQVGEPHDPYSPGEVEIAVLPHVEAAALRDVTLEDEERAVVEEDASGGCGVGAGGVVAVGVAPSRHVGEVDVSDVYAADVFGIAEGVEEGPPVGFGEVDEPVIGGDVSVEEAAEVGLQGVECYVGGGAGE